METAMAESHESQELAARIVTFRERLGLSQAELAVNSGVDLGLVAAVEAGQAYPALGVLLKLSRALGQRLGTFMDDQYRPDPLIVRARDRQQGLRQHLGTAPGARTETSIHYFALGRGKSDRHMEPLYIEISPEEPVRPTSHEGEEFLIAVSGQLVVHYGKERHTLEPGDSIYYNSIVPHAVSAGADAPATAYAVIYQPF
jgi:transcriptional regulator with XRE-family HTH domain